MGVHMRKAGLVVLILISVLASSSCTRRIQLAENYMRARFWVGGLEHFNNAQGWHGYISDECGDVKDINRDCECVALVHGLGANSMAWYKILLWPTSSWKTMGVHKPMRLLAVDLPGSGDSRPPLENKDYQVRRQAKYLGQTLAGQCSKWTVVGNSLGAWIATWLALDQPHLVKGLMLTNAAGLRECALNARALFKPTVEAMKDFQKRAFYQPMSLQDSDWQELLQRFEKEHVQQIIDAQVEEDFIDAHLANLQTPTQLLWGKYDGIIPIEAGYQMRELIPHVRFHELDQCAHVPQIENPKETVQMIVNTIRWGDAKT